ncbi:MAG: adenine-specific methyltransferase EcoRI family protein [Candidatus Vogelbacteria bacterium]
MANKNLTNAKRAKNDEFYTQYSDIQKEIEAYLEYNPDVFRGKAVYCNCDDPYESNFFKYFVLKFNNIGLKKLITTSYVPSPITGTLFPLSEIEGLRKFTRKQPFKIEINEVKDLNNDGAVNLKDIECLLRQDQNVTTLLKGNGDFRSDESIELLKQSDIVVTNPPFSLFREYIMQLVDHDKKFLIIGNLNAITYKEIFPLLKANKVWLGNNYKINAGAMFFEIPEKIANLEQVREIKTNESGKKVYVTRVQGVRWFTNLDHGRRHQPIPLMSEAEVIKFVTKKPFEKYDNYDAIEVSLIKHIPSDYIGVMGVPVSILDKYSPEQFKIVGMCENLDLYKQKTKVYTSADCKQAYLDKFGKKGTYDLNASGVVTRNDLLEKVYQRVLIKHKKK